MAWSRKRFAKLPGFHYHEAVQNRNYIYQLSLKFFRQHFINKNSGLIYG